MDAKTATSMPAVPPQRVFPQSRHPLFSVPHQPDENLIPSNYLRPIFDTLSLSDPLLPFDRQAHDENFGTLSDRDSERPAEEIPPPRPASWDDEYLYPTLSESEYDRLMLLWYYTKGIHDDSDLLSKLSHMLDIIQTSLDGWEIAIVGLVEAEHFVKVVTRNIPLAVTPRRESTCSHTINHKPGTVFAINDMSKDWRFTGSPPVAQGGLKSYAGTQLRLPLPNGKQVAFGSLCVASLQLREPLTKKQRESLVSAADVITGEIVTTKRLKRLQEKQSMAEELSVLRSKAHVESVESEIMQMLRQRYPDCSSAIAPIRGDSIALPSGECVPVTALKDGLWEDTAFILRVIESGDFERSIKDRKIRLVAAPISPNERFMVLATSKLRNVYDDLDVWYIDQCAQIINTSAQAQLLREALAAKNTFLRSVTHELRTPIHAILSSVELANEDMKSTEQQNGRSDHVVSTGSLTTFLDTIRQSGTELMITVNNILRLNAFESDMESSPSDYNLQGLESDVLEEVFQNYTDGQMPGLSVWFENTIPDSARTVKIDGDLLKELLKCLLFNAIGATPNGRVEVTISLLQEQALINFDIVDTGVGIHESDHQRIFQAFEKVDIHSSGAGLGLSLASRMASTLHGNITLVSSKLNHGSHFRLQVPHIPALAKDLSDRAQPLRNRHLPLYFKTLPNSKRGLHLIKHLESYLLKCGFTQSDKSQGSVIVTNQPDPFENNGSHAINKLDGPHVILYVCDTPISSTLKDCVQEDFKGNVVFPITGPLFTCRLDEMFVEIDSAFVPYRKDIDSTQARRTDIPSSDSKTNGVCAADPTTSGSDAVDITEPVLEKSQPKPIVKALLVDDNNVNLSVLQMYCKRRKIPHGTAVNGEEAFSQFCQSVSSSPEWSSTYTLILMDLQMPKCDGIEACKMIRNYEQEHNLPRSIILILTGQDSIRDRTNAFQAGVDDYYVKPVSVKKLDQAVAQFFPDIAG